MPDELPPEAAAHLRQLINGGDAAVATVLQGAARPGCVQLAIDLLMKLPALDAAASDPGLWQAAAEALLRRRLPAMRLAELMRGGKGAVVGGGGGDGGSPDSSPGQLSRLFQAQIGVDCVTVADVEVGEGAGGSLSRDAAAPPQSVRWADAPAGGEAPRIIAALPCALLASEADPDADAPDAAAVGGATSGKSVLLGSGLAAAAAAAAARPGGGGNFIFARSRGAFHPLPRSSAANLSPSSAATDAECRVFEVPPAARTPGLLLFEAEQFPASEGEDGAAGPAAAAVFSNQVPVVVSNDPRVVEELRRLEPALLGGASKDAAAADGAMGSSGPLGAADALQILTDVGMLLECEEVERSWGQHPLQGCADYCGAIRWVWRPCAWLFYHYRPPKATAEMSDPQCALLPPKTTQERRPPRPRPRLLPRLAWHRRRRDAPADRLPGLPLRRPGGLRRRRRRRRGGGRG
jgi:hypothetical protein